MTPQPNTPAAAGYFFPAEFYPHEATWLIWPHKEASWPGKIETIYQPYSSFVAYLSRSEKVRINVVDAAMQAFATRQL
ncbi:MAG: agmatine deiminase family protein, partial [Bacteroidota bacterium]